MNRLKRKLSYTKDGWLIQGQPGFQPGDAVQAAHDIFEHFPGELTTLEEEFQALGALIYVRWESGLLDKLDSPLPAVLENALTGILGDMIHYGNELPAPPPTHALHPNIEDIILDSLLRFYKGNKSFSETYYPDQLQQVMCNSLGWLRTGYRKAARRYRKLGPVQAGMFFARILLAGEMLKGKAKEGDTLTVSCDLGRGRIQVFLNNKLI